MKWRGRIAALTAAVAALLVPGLAHAGYGVQPIGQTFTTTTSPLGQIVSPERIDFLVHLDERDTDPFIWVSDSPLIGPAGMPAGSTVGSCNSFSFRPWVEPGKQVCSQSTILLKPGTTYYWWLDYRRLEEGSTTPQKTISGPFAFTLVQAPASPTPAAPTPAATPPAKKPASTPTARVSTKTYESAATLPTANRYTGARSIKHQRLTDVIYETMKALRLPRVLAIGCWSDFDFDAVARSADFVAHGDNTVLAGFWLGKQPRWLHLAPSVCGGIQGLLDTRQPSAARAFGLTVALHETLHAYGIVNEAQTNCFAVQLVPFAGHFIGMTPKSGDYLRRLAINVTRRTAPPGYWKHSRCRDGGDWDLLPKAANLR
jgi:hypothetical protein